MLTLNRFGNSRRPGATVVEGAVVISVCLLFLFGIYEYGRFLMMRNLLDHAAREGARRAVAHVGGLATADIQNWVTSALAGQGQQLQGLNIQVYMADNNGNNAGAWSSAGFGQYIAVQIDGDYAPVLPMFLSMNSTVHIQSKAVMYSEGN
jgi:Flp pilus assembly protein TadG